MEVYKYRNVPWIIWAIKICQLSSGLVSMKSTLADRLELLRAVDCFRWQLTIQFPAGQN